MVHELNQLGGELRKEREARNIDLQTIADRTKISITFLKAMEAGNFDFLPAPYPRNFLKMYLQCLGGKQERFLNRFDAATKMVKPTPVNNVARAAPPEKSTSAATTTQEMLISVATGIRSHYISLAVVATAIVALILTVLSVSRNDEKMPVHSVANGQPVVQQDSQLASITPFTFKKKKLHLSLVASQKTWMQIAIDDSAAVEYIFDNGDSSEWHARERFLLRIGNGAGVRLYLDGNDLGPLGRQREVVNFVVTKDGIQRNQL